MNLNGYMRLSKLAESGDKDAAKELDRQRRRAGIPLVRGRAILTVMDEQGSPVDLNGAAVSVEPVNCRYGLSMVETRGSQIAIGYYTVDGKPLPKEAPAMHVQLRYWGGMYHTFTSSGSHE